MPTSDFSNRAMPLLPLAFTSAFFHSRCFFFCFFLSRTLAIRLLREEGAVFGKDKYVMTVSTVLELLSILTTGHSSTA